MALKLVPLSNPTQENRPKFTSLEREQQEAMGDVEFEASLVNSGSQDPVSRLGFDPTWGRVDTSGSASYNTNNDVATVGSDINSEAVWNHEFRHRGVKRILNRYSGNDMLDIVGLEGTALIRSLSGTYSGQEIMSEEFDNPEDSAGNRGNMESTLEYIETLTPEQRESLNTSLVTLAERMLEEENE